MSPPPSSRDTVAKIAGLTMVNAMVFQEVLADYDAQVRHLRQTLQSPNGVSAFADHWYYILTQINYHPIFHVAHQLLLALPSNPDSEAGVRSLAQTALEVVSKRAALRHDLMGRIYHRLLADAKYLGTYYTSVPAATLLLKLALEPARWARDWADLGELSLLRIGDLACGTGTLLMAAAEAVTDNYLNACGEQRQQPKIDILSGLLMEDIIYGYDVLLSALHLTASTLALRSPDVTFRRMRLYCLPLGGPHRRLGSIEFLREHSETVSVTADLFGGSTALEQVAATGDLRQPQASLPDLDLCVMNPPFTRSVGGNLLFGSLPDSERQPLQRELGRLLRRPLPPVHASATAGLGSVFAALGDMYLKPGGRMALVLPKALLSGVAWGKTRELFRLRYQLECLIASHDPARWNFSDNTNLSEVLVVARKTDAAAPGGAEAGPVVCVNLWKNPTTAVEALAVAHALGRDAPPDLETGQGAVEVMLGEAKFGEAVSVPWASIRDGSWMGPCAFAQADVARAAGQLMKGQVYVPGRGIVGSVPLVALKQLGIFGPDRRRIVDGFQRRRTQRVTPYAAFWGHDASTMTMMAQKSNAYLSPLPHPLGGHAPGYANVLWRRAGSLLIAERLRLNTQRLVSVRLDTKVLSNVWWPFALFEDDAEQEKALMLWLNSTLGVIVGLAVREETEGSWVGFKQSTLGMMPVLDIHALASAQKQQIIDAYERLCQQPLLPFPQMAQDPVRRAIDDTLSQTLSLPDLSPLRALLAREPVICLQPLS